MQTKINHIPEPLLLYDGYCALCNKVVNIILKSKSTHTFYFTPLQGQTAKLIPQLNTGVDSVVLLYNGQLYYKAQAAFAVIKLINNAWYKPLLVFNVLPNVFTNFMYDVIAKSRYRIFGKYDACPMPPAEVRKFFLP